METIQIAMDYADALELAQQLQCLIDTHCRLRQTHPDFTPPSFYEWLGSKATTIAFDTVDKLAESLAEIEDQLQVDEFVDDNPSPNPSPFELQSMEALVDWAVSQPHNAVVPAIDWP